MPKLKINLPKKLPKPTKAQIAENKTKQFQFTKKLDKPKGKGNKYA